MGFLKGLLGLFKELKNPPTIKIPSLNRTTNPFRPNPPNNIHLTIEKNTEKELTKFYFDSSFDHFFSKDHLLFFYKDYSILEEVIKVRLGFLRSKRKIFISSRYRSFGFLNNIDKSDSVIFDTRVSKGIIRLAIEKVNSIFVVLSFENKEEILESFKKYSKKFYLLDLDLNFKCKLQKYQAAPISYFESKEIGEISINKKLEKYILGDRCLIFSKNNKFSKEIIEVKISHLLERGKKILIITSAGKDLKNVEKTQKCNFKNFLRIYKQTPNFILSYNVAIIYEIEQEDLINYVRLTNKFKTNFLVSLSYDPSKVIEVFKENYKDFIYLDFGSESEAKAKIFEKTILSSEKANIEIADFQFDSEVNKYILYNNCIVSSKYEEILRRLVKLKVDYLIDKRILIVSSLFSNFDFLDLENNKNIVAYDFEDFLNEHYFYDKEEVPMFWEKAFNETVEKFKFDSFDAFFILVPFNRALFEIVRKAFREVEFVFYGTNNESEEMELLFEEYAVSFSYLNFGFSLSPRIRSVGSKVLEKAEILTQKKVKKKIDNLEIYDSLNIEGKDFLSNFATNLVVICQNEAVCVALSKERISFLKNNLKYSAKDILFANARMNKKDLDATCYWQLAKKERDPWGAQKFKQKYKAFIFFPYTNFGPHFSNLVNEITWNSFLDPYDKKEITNTIWFFDAKNFFYGLYNYVKEKFPNSLFYYAKLENKNIVIRPKEVETETIDALLNFISEVKGDPQDANNFKEKLESGNKLKNPENIKVNKEPENKSPNLNYSNKEEKDVIFASQDDGPSYEDDPLFDENKNSTDYEEEDDDEDISGGLF